MKVFMEADEMYPVYHIDPKSSYGSQPSIEVGEDLWRDYKTVMIEFNRMQNILDDLFNEASRR